MEIFTTDKEAAPDAMSFVGNYLKKEDLTGPTVVDVVDVRAETIEGEVKRKLVACFRGFEKPLILNTTNIRRLSAIFGASNTAMWRGPIMLYVDEEVHFAGNKVGGIRVDAVAQSGAQQGNGRYLDRGSQS